MRHRCKSVDIDCVDLLMIRCLSLGKLQLKAASPVSK